MINQSDHFEAEWCSLIRKWHRAVDEAGTPVTERLQMLMNMRKYMLQHFNPFQFPPPSSHVKTMPIAQFEGTLTNIVRCLQLYGWVEKKNTIIAVSAAWTQRHSSGHSRYVLLI